MTKTKMTKSKRATSTPIKKEKIDALIFIDTNIFLDFYRMPSEKVSIQILDKIIEHKDIIISTTQLEMEFKNNRFGVLKSMLDEFNKMGSFSLIIPDIFIGDEYEGIKEARKEISKHQKSLLKKLTETIESTEKDQVYNKLNKLFRNESDINLKSNDGWQDEIYNNAQKRFNLGYPPRKSGDKTFGDGLNWEWILKCADLTGKKIIIVSRDGDYGKGLTLPILNTFLADEVVDRIGPNCEIILTDELAKAFEMVQLPLTEEMVEEEQKVISLNESFMNANKGYLEMQEYVRKLNNPLQNVGIPDYMSSALRFAELAKTYPFLSDVNPELKAFREKMKLWENKDKNNE
ncbi:MAG: DUF4935 domain-containing protein [Chryseobacterium sp.]|uniref:PIN domain-containing protein n=1 Tax=Chryseobacterium sp. TaxID=1871047 RepID=UPI001B2EE9AE|nr:PIN domain-containing protein [Chryseobacterium sp.]MBO6184189.1 DUF4935 domain-containing protein [Chryseobacterium sp.]